MQPPKAAAVSSAKACSSHESLQEELVARTWDLPLIFLLAISIFCMLLCTSNTHMNHQKRAKRWIFYGVWGKLNMDGYKASLSKLKTMKDT